MLRTLGRAVILVRDYEEALAYYTGLLGFGVIADVVLANGYRAVHVGLATQPGVGFWLMRAETDAQRARIGDQTGGFPLAVLYVEDCRKTWADLCARGVAFTGEPVASEGAVHAPFEDLYGNVLLIVELAG